MDSAFHLSFANFPKVEFWAMLISSLTITCLFPSNCLVSGTDPFSNNFSTYDCGPSAFNNCPDSLHFTGATTEEGSCICRPNYETSYFGCEYKMVTPRVRLARKGASHIGETGSNVTVSCTDTEGEYNVFRWTVNEEFAAVLDTPTFTFVLGSGSQQIRCEHETPLVYHDNRLTSEPLEVIGVDSIVATDFPNTVEGIPETAVSNTLLDLTCTNIPWTKEPLDVFWEVPGQAVVHGIGLYELEDVKIDTETSGSSVICNIKNGTYTPSTPLPSPLATDIPEIVILEQDRLAVKGQTVRLTCDFQGQPFPKTNPDISWFWLLNNTEQPGFNVPELVLTSVSKEKHEGVWRCAAQYQENLVKVSAAVNLTVLDENLTATLTTTPRDPIANAYVLIECQTNLVINVPVTYSWTFAGFPLPGFTDRILFLIHLFPLHLICTVKAGGLTVTSDQLYLIDPVQFSDCPAPDIELVGRSSGTQLNYNETYVVTCKVNSNWTVHCMEFEFFQDGIPVSKSGSQEYTISNDVIDREYTCRAVYHHLSSPISNTVVKVDFQVIKSIETHQRSTLLWFHPVLFKEINLQCDVTLYDKVPNDINYAWYNDEDVIVSNSMVWGFLVRDSVNTTYRCEAHIGNHTAVSEIAVTYGKLAQIFESVDIKETRLSNGLHSAQSTSFSLRCNFTFYNDIPKPDKVNYTWYNEDGVKVKSTQVLEVSFDYTQGTVTGTPLDKKYKCKVSVGIYSLESDYWKLDSLDELASGQGSDDVGGKIVTAVVVPVVGVFSLVAIFIGAGCYISKRGAKQNGIINMGSLQNMKDRY